MVRAHNTQPKRSTAPKKSRLQHAPKDQMISRLMVILSTVALLVIGLVMVFSASSISAFVEQGNPFIETGKQILFAIIGIAACVAIIFVTQRVGLGVLASKVVIYGLWLVCIMGVLATAAFGTSAGGAKRWLLVGPISIQIAEFLKIALTLVAAQIMLEFNEGSDAANILLRIAFFIVAPLALLIVLQSDLGTTFICLVSVIAILILGGVPVRWILALVALIGVVVAGAIATSPYRAARFLSFLNPWENVDAGGFQIVQSMQGLAAGGIFGVGIGNSYEKLLYLPEAETDFIFTIVGEELGIIGAMLVVVLFIVFLYGSYSIAKDSTSTYGMLIAGALSTMIVAQAFINILCVIGAFPITGKPLPFISSGGSSLISSLVIVGIILSVSFASDSNERIHQAAREKMRVVSTYDTALPARDGARVSRGFRTNYGHSADGAAGRTSATTSRSVRPSRPSKNPASLDSHKSNKAYTAHNPRKSTSAHNPRRTNKNH